MYFLLAAIISVFTSSLCFSLHKGGLFLCVSTISSGTSRQRSAVLSELECLMESFDILPSLSCSDEAAMDQNALEGGVKRRDIV